MTVRVGTWNIEGNPSPVAVELLLGLRAQVLLLTEVPPGFKLPGYHTIELRHPTMRPDARDGQHYAAVAAVDGLELEQVAPPPGTSAVTSAAARGDGAAFVSTALPWAHAPAPPYVGATQAEQTERALDEVEPWLTLPSSRNSGPSCGAAIGTSRSRGRCLASADAHTTASRSL